MKQYDNYKDSGIDWIGEIPEHWEYWKISHAFKRIGSGTTPESGNPIYHENGTINWLNTGDLNDGILEFCSKKVTEKALEDYSSLKLFPAGSLVMAMYGATIGKTTIINFETTTNQACCVFCTGDIIDVNFLQYWFIGNKEHIINLAIGGGQPNISQNILKDIRIWCPNISEQIELTNYLDNKTTQIDSLISKKQQFITLLQEERIAVINQAVTKGLHPKVKMKDSGIECLGEIPEHWGVKKLKYVGNCQNGISEGADYFGSGYPFVSYSDVYKNNVLPTSVVGLAQSTQKHQEHYSVQESDVFFTRTSETIEEIGIASICYNTIEKAVFAGFLIKFRPNKELIIKEFSKYYFRCFIPRTFFIKEMNLVTRASLSQELLKRLPILLPSIDEQKEIAFYLDKKTNEIDKIISKTQQEIELLKEYKTALISEVVTGKVDVRELVLN